MEVPDKYVFPICENEGAIDSTIRKIYERLADEETEAIFEDRLMYSLTSDYRYIRRMVLRRKEGRRLYDTLQKAQEHGPIYVYGAGIKGTRIVSIFPDINWGGFVDQKKGGVNKGLTIYKPDYLLQVAGYVLVSNQVDPWTIKSTLVGEGVPEDKILILREFDGNDSIYFDDDIFPNRFGDSEKAFIDVGSFDGTDTIRYLNWRKRQVPIRVFEADKNNYALCVENLAGQDKTRIYNIALSDKREKRFFDAKGTSSSRFANAGEEVSTDMLDNICAIDSVGYIKMDIEGAEGEALMGAKKIIKQQSPVLAVSIYHRRSDIWEIPRMIIENSDDYVFFLRHYTVGVTDTVLYAVPRQ